MKVPLSFETSNQAIMNISKDIDATTKKIRTQKQKKLEAKPKKMKADVKATRKEIMKKRTPIVEIFSSCNNEFCLPPSK
jgi:septal ring factor EnvC (AmiA/AmiB activator)